MVEYICPKSSICSLKCEHREPHGKFQFCDSNCGRITGGATGCNILVPRSEALLPEAQEQPELISKLRELYPNGHPKFLDISLKEMALHSDKNHDYAKGGDPLGNFKRVAEIMQLYPKMNWATALGVALVYSLKQIDAVLWAENGQYTGKVEGAVKRMEDVSVYWKIAQIIKGESDEKQTV